MRHNTKRMTLNAQCLPVILCIALFFAIASVLCPIALMAKNNKPGTRAPENLKEEKKEDTKADSGEEAATPKGEESQKAGENTTKSTAEEGLLTKEYTEDSFKPQVEEESYVWMVFKALFVIGLLVGGFYYFFRFVTKKAGIQVLGGEAIQILSVVPLGQNKYLQIVDIAGKILILGVSDNNINLITEIADRDEVDRIRLLSSRSPSPDKQGFQDYIVKQIGKLIGRVSEIKGRDKKIKTTATEGGVDMDYLRQQRKRLKDLNGYSDE